MRVPITVHIPGEEQYIRRIFLEVRDGREGDLRWVQYVSNLIGPILKNVEVGVDFMDDNSLPREATWSVPDLGSAAIHILRMAFEMRRSYLDHLNHILNEEIRCFNCIAKFEGSDLM